MVEDVFNLPAEDVLELRDTLPGLANTDYDYRKAWLTSAQVDRLFAKDAETAALTARARTIEASGPVNWGDPFERLTSLNCRVP